MELLYIAIRFRKFDNAGRSLRFFQEGGAAGLTALVIRVGRRVRRARKHVKPVFAAARALVPALDKFRLFHFGFWSRKVNYTGRFRTHIEKIKEIG